MYYDIIYYKIIPAIYLAINNKTINGYYEVFNYIKSYIMDTIKNKIDRIKWKKLTSDFEYSLYTSFIKTFNILEIKHIGYFLHFMKNIKNFLRDNGFTKLKNKKI